MSDIHFGKMIDTELRKQRYSVDWFAKQMGSDRSNMYKLLSRQHLNSEFIIRASKKDTITNVLSTLRIVF